ncbi:MAG: FHA domain-containing protein [Tepidisphaeraceae bacterium]
MQTSKLTITLDEVNSPRVEAKLKERELITRTQDHYQQAQLPTATARPPRFAFLYNTVVYMGLFGLLGGLLGWTFGEVMHFRPNPRMEARELLDARRQLDAAVTAEQLTAAEAALAAKEIDRTGRDNPYYAIQTDATFSEDQKRGRWRALATKDDWTDFLANVLFYSVCGMTIAICLGIAESVVDRNWQAAITNGSVAAVVGLVGGIVVSLFVDRLYDAIVGGPDTDAAMGRRIVARMVSWGVLGLFLAAAPGVVLRNVKKLWIGATGGLLGGVIGGILFEPLARATGDAHVSRLIAIVVIGVVAGVAAGLIENAAKTGWFKVVAGVIAGKQFVLYRNPTYIGSSPQCHIYLFKDPQVGRRHAAVHLVPGGYEIEDLPLGAKTIVNDRPVTRARLRNGDRVQIGSTSFNFMEKVKR